MRCRGGAVCITTAKTAASRGCGRAAATTSKGKLAICFWVAARMEDSLLSFVNITGSDSGWLVITSRRMSTGVLENNKRGVEFEVKPKDQRKPELTSSRPRAMTG